MKINNTELIKKIRTDMGLTQAEMANRLYLDQRTLSRIETGRQKMDIWDFASLMENLGYPTEDFWLLYLETEEFEAYKLYRRLKKALRSDNHDEKLELISKLESGVFAKKRFVQQFIAFVKITATGNKSDAERLTGLQSAIRVSRPDFDENAIADYRLNYNEVFILNDMAGTLYALDEKKEALHCPRPLLQAGKIYKPQKKTRQLCFPLSYPTCQTCLVK